MATDRQIAANRINASRSTGPRTDEGKARSRANAATHGLAGATGPVEPGAAAAFEGRRASWGEEYRPVGEAAGWALDRAVAASFRIERCERATEEITRAARERAILAWDLDRRVEAATIAGRLGRDPVLASRQLQATRAGAEVLVESWVGLLAKLETGEDWSDHEASKALDLLGVATDLRSGRTEIDAGPGLDPRAYRRSLALEEVDRLEALIEAVLTPLDESERQVAIGGHLALLSKPARLVLRYEREAWRRYRESIREVRESAPSAVVEAPTAPSRPGVRERALAVGSDPVGRERRGELDDPEPSGLDEESAWMEEMERRIEAKLARGSEARGAGDPRGRMTERTRLVGVDG